MKTHPYLQPNSVESIKIGSAASKGVPTQDALNNKGHLSLRIASPTVGEFGGDRHGIQ